MGIIRRPISVKDVVEKVSQSSNQEHFCATIGDLKEYDRPLQPVRPVSEDKEQP